MSDGLPVTRWEREVNGDNWIAYRDRFAQLHADGVDVDGEARLVDALLPRQGRVLDAGCGTGRVTAALTRRGHWAVGVDRDAGLVQVAAERYPNARYLVSDLLALTGDKLSAAGAPSRFDVIAVPGNVMVYLAPGSERDVLAVLAGLLKPGGRMVVGFATDREYSVASFDADARSAGLRLDGRFASWQLDPWTEESGWAVTLLSRPEARVESASTLLD